MEKSFSASYAAAGVDITAGYKAVELMKQHVARTVIPGVMGGLGGFGGLFELDCTNMPHPVLVSGTDGVGTKLKIAFLMDKHDTVGIDCVAMCVNDVVCAGAKPLIFLDYIACGKNVPERIAQMVAGVAEGCVQAGCALVGGETAEMPGFYPEDEYDLAGFTVGAVDKSKILSNEAMVPGDVIIALPSSGVHSNGFSLVRRVFDLENHPEVLKEYHEELGCTLGEALLAPTRIYVKQVLAVMDQIAVKGVSHITGGGFYENIPRVDITAGYKAVELMKQHVARTVIPGVMGGLGGFGGLFELDCTNMPHPVLVSGTDGVGTKLKIAFLMDKHDTVGIDCVAMCVNDVVCAGAKPLIFLDYIACGKNVPERIAQMVAGVAEGCVQAGCALVGGETAEMPGFYPEDEYDLAGFTVGAVDKSKILSNEAMVPGDVIIALPSSGVHSNGFSLVRRVFDLENHPEVLKEYHEELGCTLGEALLAPTRIYVKQVLAVMDQIAVKGVSHITGGGFYENIPRALAAGCVAKIKRSDVRVLPVFELLQKTGKIPERDMFNTFNMGVGMTLVVPADKADEAVRVLAENGQEAYFLGEIAKGEEKGVELV